jgi:hypothetical protein
VGCDQGNNPAISAFMIQCDEEPILWPFERTREGNTLLYKFFSSYPFSAVVASRFFEIGVTLHPSALTPAPDAETVRSGAAAPPSR